MYVGVTNVPAHIIEMYEDAFPKHPEFAQSIKDCNWNDYNRISDEVEREQNYIFNQQQAKAEGALERFSKQQIAKQLKED
jgi:hypothetical protein